MLASTRLARPVRAEIATAWGEPVVLGAGRIGLQVARRHDDRPRSVPSASAARSSASADQRISSEAPTAHPHERPSIAPRIRPARSCREQR